MSMAQRHAYCKVNLETLILIRIEITNYRISLHTDIQGWRQLAESVISSCIQMDGVTLDENYDVSAD